MRKMEFRFESEREEIAGVSGGFLPVYVEGEADAVAACSCVIGDYRMQQYGVVRYDSLPGTSRSDTKHSIMMGIGRRNEVRQTTGLQIQERAVKGVSS